MRILDRQQIREADRLTIDRLAVASFSLMDRAGREAAAAIRRRYGALVNCRVSIFAGRGSNGGDGFVIARLLSEGGAAVRVFFLGRLDEITGDARIHADALSPHLPITPLVDEAAWTHHRVDALQAEVLVDALFGTGLTRPLSGLAAAVVSDMNAARAPIVAIDVPSGLSADRTDVPGPAIHAAMTVTMAAPKLPLAITPACLLAGELLIADIGIPASVIDALPGRRVEWLDAAPLGRLVTPRPADGHKGLYGHVLVVGGSRGKVGAPALSARAALRSGAGLVTVATPVSCWPIVAGFAPEIMTEPLPETDEGTIAESAIDRVLAFKADVIAVGPGLGRSASTTAFLRGLVSRSRVPLVIDADALNALADHADLLRSRPSVPAILTPHPGEMARLTGLSTADLQNRRLDVARDFAVAHHVHVVLKGHRTIVATPAGDAFVNSVDNPGMATAGAGDVLTGVIAAWLGYLKRPIDAATLGVYLHGLAGNLAAARLGEAALIAGDIIESLGSALTHVRAAGVNGPHR